LEDLDADASMILKGTLQQCIEKFWTGIISFRFVGTRYGYFGYVKGIEFLAYLSDYNCFKKTTFT